MIKDDLTRNQTELIAEPRACVSTAVGGSAPAHKPTRNNVVAICKGIAIILMVVGHAEAPGFICNFLYTFHMPLFFITAGYFFSRKYLTDPWTFCSKRFSGLYIPFLKWSIIFLVLHNIWFRFGILNETYGNWTGGVTHPYSWHEAMSRIVRMVFGMSGYDEFMAGAFWFFRGLLVASLMYLFLAIILERRTRLKEVSATLVIMAIAWGFTAFRIFNNLNIPLIPNGGMREIWGLFFFAAGVTFRNYESYFRRHWFLLLASFLIIAGASILHTCGMNNNGKPQDLLTLPITGCIGFLMTYWLSGYIDNLEGMFAWLRKGLAFIGENTLPILLLHIPCFKIVSLLKIHYYDLDPLQIGCHMVIHHNNTDFFWPLYTLAGVGLPLLLFHTGRRLRSICRHRLNPSPS